MSQNLLNAKALEAAFEEANSPATVSRTTKQTVEAAIRAYLASQEAAAPSEAMRDELLAADAADPEATFDNGADMLDWLNAPAAAPSGKITQAELVAMFGDAMPIEAAELLWKCPPDWTTDRLRSELRALASPAVAPVADAKQKIIEFAQAILHGDDEHRGWLMGAALAFNAGDELPAPRGKGTAPVAPVAVSVKAKDLKWRENPLGNFVAETIVGQYFVFKEDGVWNWVVVDISAWRNFPSPEAAKAAAQADFNARILSSIIPATKGGEASELRRAANALINNLWIGVVSGKRSHEENWREFERRFPGVKWLHDELAALSAQDTDGVAK
ncbi:hypothetical protein NKI13_24485 [Mesorhizobium australicum]|uniref:hypothetical protein n=1 Tax=Mesorhizobium australicum TaxID=536018 RepID=UPI003336B76D